MDASIGRRAGLTVTVQWTSRKPSAVQTMGAAGGAAGRVVDTRPEVWASTPYSRERALQDGSRTTVGAAQGTRQGVSDADGEDQGPGPEQGGHQVGPVCPAEGSPDSDGVGGRWAEWA